MTKDSRWKKRIMDERSERHSRPEKYMDEKSVKALQDFRQIQYQLQYSQHLREKKRSQRGKMEGPAHKAKKNHDTN